MNVIQELLNEYIRMRENGLDAKATLHALRPYIEPLPEQHKAELAKLLRKWERGELEEEKQVTTSTDEVSPYDVTDVVDEVRQDERPDSTTKTIKRLSPIKPIAKQESRPGEDILPPGLRPGATWIACPNCNTKNKANEIFCYACGHLMDSGQGFNATRSFSDANMSDMPPEHYGRDSLLILQVRDSGSYYKLRPQNYTHEIVIGRSSSNTAMKPDVDLGDENADEFGVSRLHLAIQYVMENNTLIVFDLGSANGSFIGGQKLHPSEKRILRNGDELRIGRMMMRVSYEHPGPELT